MDFSKFDEQVDSKQLQEQIKDAKENGDFGETPAGSYEAKIEKLELGETKDGRPMFKAQLRLIAGLGDEEEKYMSRFKKKKPCIFMNRVMFGTKNDGMMINSVLGWLDKLEPEKPVTFGSYSEFSKLILDLDEELEGLNCEIKYDNDAFNSISIVEVWDD